MGAQDYLWLLTLLLIKADLRKKHYDNLGGQKSSKLTMEERLQQLCDLFAMFDSNVTVQVTALKQMIQYTEKNSVPARKLLGISQSSTTSKLSAQDQFDMIRIKMLAFVNSLMTSHVFTNQLIQVSYSSRRTCRHGDWTLQSFWHPPYPISTRREQIMATLYWCPHQVFKIHISITSLAKTINALFMSLGDIWASICIKKTCFLKINISEKSDFTQ